MCHNTLVLQMDQTTFRDMEARLRNLVAENVVLFEKLERAEHRCESVLLHLFLISLSLSPSFFFFLSHFLLLFSLLRFDSWDLFFSSGSRNGDCLSLFLWLRLMTMILEAFEQKTPSNNSN
jgi:hypothetical protein